MKLMQILEVNNVIKKGLEEGLGISNLMENWDFLQARLLAGPRPRAACSAAPQPLDSPCTTGPVRHVHQQ